jgi:hypothetical protein
MRSIDLSTIDDAMKRKMGKPRASSCRVPSFGTSVSGAIAAPSRLR